MNAPRVYADFQNLDDSNRLRLTRAGTVRDLGVQGLTLRDGLVLTLYADDADDQGCFDELQAEGVVHYSNEDRCWVATIDWTAIRHASTFGPLIAEKCMQKTKTVTRAELESMIQDED